MLKLFKCNLDAVKNQQVKERNLIKRSCREGGGGTLQKMEYSTT